MYLRDDLYPLWADSSPLATTGTVYNSQCTLDAGASYAVISETQLTLTLALTFTASFAGAQDIYAIADNGALNSGWSEGLGSWTVTAPVGALPTGWTAGSQDAVNQASYANGVFTLTGRSQFVYQPLVGDGTLIARVAAVQNNGDFSSAGIIMRAGLNSTSPSVSVGAPTSSSGCFCIITGALPYWLKLERSNGVVTAFVSDNGADWTQSGSPVSLPGTTVYAGLYIGTSWWSAPVIVTFDHVAVATGPDFYLISAAAPFIRVNAGGGAYTDPGGTVWNADYGFSGGSGYSTGSTITGTPTPALYQSERYSSSNLQYQFTVPNGTYDVTLKFAEIYYTQAGSRSFNVSLNGNSVLTKFDVFAAAGGANIAVDRQFTVAVTNGTITILLTPVVSTAKINGIEIAANPQAFSIVLHPLYGFSGAGALALGGLPSGASASFNPTSLSASSPSLLRVTPATGTAAGNYPLWISATSGNINRGVGDSLFIPGTPAAPTFSPPGGTYSLPQSATLSSATPGALLRYTTDGSTPSSTGGSPYTGPITVSSSMTIKAIAYGTGSIPSAVASAAYVISNTTAAAAPTFSPPGGVYGAAQNVTLSTTTSGATILYTTDGTTPSSNPPVGTTYTAPIPVNVTTTIKALAYAPGLADSAVTLATYTINPPVATPTFSPTGGIFATPKTVIISTSTPAAEIRYTTDGTTPTPLTGTIYTSPITISAWTKLQAIAYVNHMSPSAVASAVFTIETDRKAIVIRHTKVSGSSSLTNFPMLFSVTDPRLRSVSNGGGVGKSDGTDILFTASDGATKLDHELEIYDPAAGQIVAWIRIPTLSPSADTVIYTYFGSPSAPDQQNRAGAWDSNFKGVWHLPDGTTISGSDSTGNANSAALSNTSAVAGKFGGGAYFSTANALATITSLSLAASDYTIESWFEYPLISGNLWNTLTRGSSCDHQVIVQRSNLELGMYDNGSSAFRGSGFLMSSLSTGWHHLVAVGSGSATDFYIDGIQVGSAAKKSACQISYFGNYPGGSQQFGKIDEVRISNSTRSAAWIATEYNNQSSPGTFFSFDPPAAPTGLTATAATSQVSLGWTASSGATGYNVKRGTASGGPYGTTVASGVTATSYTDTTVANGTTYYYVVSAVSGSGESSDSSQASATPIAIPGVPSVTTGGGSAQLALSWSSASGATGYNVRRSTASGGPYTIVATVTSTSYVNTGLTSGTTYYYVISGVNSSGEGTNSSQASGKPVATPTGLTATAGNKRVTLNWTAAAGASTYNVKRATTDGGPYTTIATGVTGTTYTNTGLTRGTRYYYVVSGVNSSGESANSAQASAVP